MTATGRTDLTALDAPLRALFEVVAVADRPGAPDLAAIGRAMVTLARDHDHLLPRDRGAGRHERHAPAPRPGARPAADAGPPHARARSARSTTTAAGSPWRPSWAWRRTACIASSAAASRRGWSGSPSRRSTTATAATIVPPNDLHDHGHLVGQGDAAYVLIMTGDDQNRFVRQEWDLATGRHKVLPVGERGRWVEQRAVLSRPYSGSSANPTARTPATAATASVIPIARRRSARTRGAVGDLRLAAQVPEVGQAAHREPDAEAHPRLDEAQDAHEQRHRDRQADDRRGVRDDQRHRQRGRDGQAHDPRPAASRDLRRADVAGARLVAVRGVVEVLDRGHRWWSPGSRARRDVEPPHHVSSSRPPVRMLRRVRVNRRAAAPPQRLVGPGPALRASSQSTQSARVAATYPSTAVPRVG